MVRKKKKAIIEYKRWGVGYQYVAKVPERNLPFHSPDLEELKGFLLSRDYDLFIRDGTTRRRLVRVV